MFRRLRSWISVAYVLLAHHRSERRIKKLAAENKRLRDAIASEESGPPELTDEQRKRLQELAERLDPEFLKHSSVFSDQFEDQNSRKED